MKIPKGADSNLPWSSLPFSPHKAPDYRPLLQMTFREDLYCDLTRQIYLKEKMYFLYLSCFHIFLLVTCGSGSQTLTMVHKCKLFEKTLQKALRTQALTALTSNFGLIGTTKRTTSRKCFLYISDKIHIKRNFLKKRNKMAKFGK